MAIFGPLQNKILEPINTKTGTIVYVVDIIKCANLIKVSEAVASPRMGEVVCYCFYDRAPSKATIIFFSCFSYSLRPNFVGRISCRTPWPTDTKI
jgi:hypothetical protein